MSSYAKFIVANEALTKCWESVSVEQWNSMNASTQAVVCRSEKEAVADILRSDELAFRNLIGARIAALKAQQQ